MKKKKIWVGILLFIVIAGLGVYFSYWILLHRTAILTQPSADENKGNIESTSEGENSEKQDKGWIDILILGTDNRGNEIGRTDTIMLVMANVNTHRVSIISIPRDTRVNLEGVGLTKINHANAVGSLKGGSHQGTLESAKAVSNLLGVTINYYVKIDFEGFQKAVDAVDGIDINLPYAVDDYSSGAHFAAGEQHLTGEDALRLARSRYGVPHGDFDRQQFQFMLVSALVHKMLNISNIPNLYGQVQVIYQELLDTNLTTAEMLTKGLQFKGLTNKDIQYYQLPGKGITALDPLIGADLYYFEPDMEKVQEIVTEAQR